MNGSIQNLTKSLLSENIDILDVVPIPKHGDRMVRLRTLEEALEDFEQTQNDEDVMAYMIHVRKARPAAEPTPSWAAPRLSVDGTYLPDGKINTPFLLKNAEILLASGELTLSRNIFNAILQSGENAAKALFGLARCFEAEGKAKEAQRHYEESIAYHNTLEAYQRLASLHLREKQEQNAAETLTRALHLKNLSLQDRFELHKSLGSTLARTSDNARAREHLTKALELNPAADELRSQLGDLHLKIEEPKKAARFYHEAAAANPKNDSALTGLGMCALAEGDKRAAHDFFARALELKLSNPTAVFHLVKCAYELKSYATAARILADYIEIGPVNMNLMYSLAGLQFHLSRFEQAQATVDRILQVAPEHTGAKDLAAIIAKYTGQS